MIEFTAEVGVLELRGERLRVLHDEVYSHHSIFRVRGTWGIANAKLLHCALMFVQEYNT